MLLLGSESSADLRLKPYAQSCQSRSICTTLLLPAQLNNVAPRGTRQNLQLESGSQGQCTLQTDKPNSKCHLYSVEECTVAGPKQVG